MSAILAESQVMLQEEEKENNQFRNTAEHKLVKFNIWMS